MKKIKVLLYSAAFVLALSASFAFKTSAIQANNAFVKNPTPFCTTAVFCNTGATPCIRLGQQAYIDKGTCMLAAGMH